MAGPIAWAGRIETDPRIGPRVTGVTVAVVVVLAVAEFVVGMVAWAPSRALERAEAARGETVTIAARRGTRYEVLVARRGREVGGTTCLTGGELPVRVAPSTRRPRGDQVAVGEYVTAYYVGTFTADRDGPLRLSCPRLDARWYVWEELSAADAARGRTGQTRLIALVLAAAGLGVLLRLVLLARRLSAQARLRWWRTAPRRAGPHGEVRQVFGRFLAAGVRRRVVSVVGHTSDAVRDYATGTPEVWRREVRPRLRLRRRPRPPGAGPPA